MTDPESHFDLSTEQMDTARLLDRLLGKAVADRYVDFCHLAAGTLDLRVSLPIAAHVLRELESILRQTLAVPLEWQSPPEYVDPTIKTQLEMAAEQLRKIGFRGEPLRRALDELKPRLSHKDQIRAIVTRLGLSPDGDVARAWLSISNAHSKAHARPFHRASAVDDEFRATWQRPFDLVVRGAALAFQRQYADLLLRVEQLAAETDRARAVRLFEREVVGALPVQSHFFQCLKTSDWLPRLVDRELVGEPYVGLDGAIDYVRYGEWAVGDYLLRMARLPEPDTRRLVVQALRGVASSNHPDVRRKGIAIMAALPPVEAAPLADIAAAWLDHSTFFMGLQEPELLVKRLAEGGEHGAAITVATSLLQLFEQNDQLATLYSRYMYEHSLPGITNVLTATCGLAALKLLCHLLHQAAVIDGKVGDDPPHDWTDFTNRPITDDAMADADIYDALIRAVRNSAESISRASASEMPRVMEMLTRSPLKIFKRIALSVLAQNPGAEPARASRWLMDTDLLEAGWCREEYGALASAWFPRLDPLERAEILRSVDLIPDRHLAAWKVWIERQMQRPPTPDQERIFRLGSIRDVLWSWRSALPADRRAALMDIVAELGDPDSWKHPAFQADDESPLTARDFSTRPVAEIAAFLKSWRPAQEPRRQTATSLAAELRQAVLQNPATYAEHAAEFIPLAPLYTRHVLEGLHSAASNQRDLPWPGVLQLIEASFVRIDSPVTEAAVAEGDDRNWLGACMAAAELLKAGLWRGADSIGYECAGMIRSLITTLLRKAPPTPELDDFEERFDRDPYFGAAATLRGASVELCLLLIFWLSKHEASSVASTPREAMTILPEIRDSLEAQLGDRSPSGRVPRAILGRYLGWLFYFGKDWLCSHLPDLFPPNNHDLRRAAWRAHLLHDGGPILPLMPQLEPCYDDEISLLSDGRHARDVEYRQNRLGDYVALLYLMDVLPAVLLDRFVHAASSRLLQRVMWFVGVKMRQQPSELADHQRARAKSYWRIRLDEAIRSPTPDAYREELGAIGQWCIGDSDDPSWLLDQLLLMLHHGFAPRSIFSLVEWLAKICPSHVDQAVEVLAGIVTNPHADRSEYLTRREAVRAVLTEGQRTGTARTVERVSEIVSFFASIRETGYLDLVRPPPATPRSSPPAEPPPSRGAQDPTAAS